MENHETKKQKNLEKLKSQKFGKLEVIERGIKFHSSYKFFCHCDCGNFCYISGIKLTRGETIDCGCRRFDNKIGEKFNKLTCMELVSSGRHLKYKFLCDCGKEVIKDFVRVKAGLIKSCGCHTRDGLRESMIGKEFLGGVVISEDGIRWKVKCHCGTIYCTKKPNIVGNNSTRQNKGCMKCHREKMKQKTIDREIGKKYGRLTIIAVDDSGLPFYDRKVICKCECYNFMSTRGENIKKGKAKSCGCYNIDVRKAKSTRNKRCKTYQRRREERIKNGNYDIQGFWRGCGLHQIVYRRDNFTCLKCNKKSCKRFNCHHILNWKDNPAKEHRFGINNLATLCYDCHKTFHSKYGQRRNTLEQFEDYIGRKWLPEYVHIFECDDYGIIKFTDFDPIYLGI